jgi:hypothetical protein
MAISVERLNETLLKYKAKYDGCKEDYFAALYLSDKFEKPLLKTLDYCAFGNNDYGIDAYYIDRETRNLYLYQFKWSDNYELFKETYKRLIRNGIEQIFGNPNVDSSINPIISRLKLDLQEFQNLIDKVYICFVFNGDPEKAESSRVLESFREELEAKKHFIDSFFGSNVTLTIQYISNETKRVNQTSRTKKTFQYSITFKAQSQKTAAGGEQMFLGFIKLHDLYRMFCDMKQRLFEKNIRAGLSDDLAPNQAIKRSLRDIIITKKVSPEYFTFHHNGITLFAEKLSFENGNAVIVEPRILNGAQTITTLSRFIEDSQKNPTFQENIDLLKEIEVIGKVVTNCSAEFVTQITISNNKQNPVESWNLRANDLIQLEFDDKFKNDGIFYERQENTFANLTYADLEELGIEQDKEIKIKKLAQTFLAFQGEIDKISETSKVFETDSLYEKTFKTDFLKADTRRIILGYKVQFRLGAIIREIESKGENKYYFVRLARNLVWALIIQALLNDDDIDELLDVYGHTLSVEANLNEYFKGLGTRRVRIILSELIKLKRYADFVEEEKFSFLKTKIAFQECMTIAKKRWGWEIKYLHQKKPSLINY